MAENPAVPPPRAVMHELSPLFELNPIGSIQFLMKCIRSGMWMGGGTIPLTLYILYKTYDSTHSIDMILRYYHISRILVYVIQLPLRIILLQRLNAAAQQPNRIQILQSLSELIHTRTWSYNHQIGQLIYISLSFAVSFMLNTKLRLFRNAYDFDDSTVLLYRLLVFNVITFFSHMTVSFFWMNTIFADVWFDTVSRSKGATTETINSVTQIVPYKQITHNNTIVTSNNTSNTTTDSTDTVTAIIEETCIICFNEYVPDDNVRVLQCRHGYHVQCIDTWLQAKAHCPLCSTALSKKNN